MSSRGTTLSLFNRYSVFVCCLLLAALSLWLLPRASAWWPLAVLAIGLSVIGSYDLLQTRRAVLRNYPMIGHIRYFVESIRPEIRQYLLEADDEKLPFSRAQRSLVYQRAKNDQQREALRHADRCLSRRLRIHRSLDCSRDTKLIRTVSASRSAARSARNPIRPRC